MGDTALAPLIRRDRAVILVALIAVTALAWLYVVWLAQDMAMPAMNADSRGMDGFDGMRGMEAMAPMAPQAHSWSGADFGFTFAMWAVMMVGMMTPSAAPMILLYARVARQAQAQAQGHVFASTGWFAGGYLLAWVAFSALATLAQGALVEAALITPMLESASHYFGGAVLIAAGIYQWTPLKDACLGECRAPMQFIMRHGGFKPQVHRALLLGLRHGLYCVACCWVLMLLLFVGGVMNLLWIAGIAIFVLAERAFPGGRIVARVGGAALIAAGAWMLLAPVS
jgi:predicted metal-binding membrane protein